MCDTLIALGNSTADGSVIFAKNSDREPNEAHEVVIIPDCEFPEGSNVQCTYITIPQVKKTNKILLAKPSWMWGTEMGANEWGVVIGNEAVFTRVPYEKGPGLTGMDLIRLALERSRSATEALNIIIDLLETYGQGGNCGFTKPFYYHNSFIIADLHEAWVLETAGKQWAAIQIKDIRTISNAITIGNQWDFASSDLIHYAQDQGWCKKSEDFHFGKCYSDPLVTFAGFGRGRQACTAKLLENQKGRITPAMVMGILRDHQAAGVNWKIDKSLMKANVCMHVGFGPIRINQSVGSMVSHLTPQAMTHWVTGTSAPCTSIFKPVWLDGGLPNLGPSPKGEFLSTTLWWQHEQLHRNIVMDFNKRHSLIQKERDQLELLFILGSESFAQASPEEKFSYTQRCFFEAAEATKAWIDKIERVPIQKKTAFYYRNMWQKTNQEAHWPEEG